MKSVLKYSKDRNDRRAWGVMRGLTKESAPIESVQRARLLLMCSIYKYTRPQDARTHTLLRTVSIKSL